MSETTAANSWNEQVIREFRAGTEPIANMFPSRSNLLLLHSVGARSGQERISPLAYFDFDGRVVIIASYAGSPKHPAWYHNLVAHPEVEIERWHGDDLRTEKVRAEVVADEAERDELWQRVITAAPNFAEYQTKTDRVIPLFVLHQR